MKRWIFDKCNRMPRERRDLTLEVRTSEVRNAPESLQYLELEKEIIEVRKRAADSAERELVGLALSGGGIRSATFCCGVLQVLERKGLMKHVDYLSTVSGGGYIGATYSAWRLRQALYADGGSRCEIHKDLKVQVPPPQRWGQMLPHLRNFSNYISPRLGSGIWRVVSTMVRNLAVHWFALVSAIVLAFALLLLTLRFMWTLSLVFSAFGLILIGRGLVTEIRAQKYFSRCQAAGQTPSDLCADAMLAVRRLLQEPRLQVFAGLALYGLAAALWFVSTTHPAFPRSFGTWLQGSGAGPALAFLTNGWPWSERFWPMDGSGIAVAALVVLLSAVLVSAVAFMSEWRWRPRRDFTPRLSWLGFLFVLLLIPLTWSTLAAVNGDNTVASAETIAVADLFTRTTAWSVASAWDYVWQTSLVLGLFAMIVSIVIAVFNQEMDREEREWTTRLISVCLVTALAWLALAGIAMASCKLAEWVLFREDMPQGAVLSGVFGLSGVWLALSGWAARLGKTEVVSQLVSKNWKRLLVAIGPTVFAVGLVTLVCFGAAVVVMKVAQTAPMIAEVLAPHRATAILWSGWYVFILLVVAAAMFIVAGVILDPNEFSLHGFYRDRLVRCFLGASNTGNPAPDSLWNIRTDDLPLSATLLAVLGHGAPLHLFNAAVNLFGSKDLRVQRRHCDSFVLTPVHCGSHVTNYAPTPPRLYLGTAMAISGAAVSPNMGLFTRDAALASLMTFFNLRLGYWFGNPRKSVSSCRKRPLFAPRYLFAEAFALTNEDRGFVNLSDGGHYDNLGLYELVRRRCRYIIAVDSECDPQYSCGALAWLVRMARIDFGTEIRIDIECLKASATQTPRALTHWLLGEIYYPPKEDGSDSGERGIMLYIKSSLFADGKNSHLAADVLEYATCNPNFPHESTADQFFSESQFEAYRMLGEGIAEEVLREVPASPHNLSVVFERLKEIAASHEGVGAPHLQRAPEKAHRREEK